jgi:hypothetical protein
VSDVSAGTTSVSVRGGGIVVEATSYGFIDLVTPAEPFSTQVNRGLASVSVTTLTDTFDASVDKTNRWPDSSVATVWDPGTQSAKIPCTSSYWSLNTPQGAKANYDFTGSYVFAKVTPATGGTGTRETLMEIQGVDSVNNKISFYVSGATLFARTTSGGANTAVFSAAYDQVNHLWLRLREAGGTTFYDTSPDGRTWTNFASTANPPWDIAHISVGFTSGYYGTETAADTFIDNVNFSSSSVALAGSAGGVATVTSALGVARALVGQASGGAISALLFEPFDSFSAWTVTGSGISIAAGRNGTGALITQGGTSVRYTIPGASESDTVTVGFAFLAASLPGATLTSVILILRSDAAVTIHDRLVVDEFGALSFWRNVTQLGASSPAGVIAAGTWAYIEVQAKLHDTTGFGIVRVNGVNVINISAADTKNAGTKTTFDTISLERGVSIGNLTYDDLYVDVGATSTFKGDIVLPLPPSSVALAVARGLVGESDGIATATAASMTSLTALAGQSDGLATVAGVLGVPRGLAGQSDGVATAGVPSMAIVRGLNGVSVGVGLVTGAMVTAMALTGRSDGAGGASGTGPNVLRPLSATAGGIGGVSAALAVGRALAGAAGGTSVSTGALVRAVGLVGRSDGLSTTVSDMGQGFVLLAGQAAGQATASGSLSVARALVARADGVSTATSFLVVARSFSGQADGNSAASGFMIVAYALVGLSEGAGTAVGTVIRNVSLAGAAVGMSAVGPPALSLLNGRVFVWRGLWVPQTPEMSPLLVWNGTRWAEDAEVWEGTRWVPLNPVWV